VKETRLALPYIGLIAGTRVALGIGIGLLVAERLGERARRGAAWGLLALGGLSTIPLALKVRGGVRLAQAS
jgi:hypothetical protein